MFTALLGKLLSRNVALELMAGINFVSPLQAVNNTSTGYTDVSIEGLLAPTQSLAAAIARGGYIRLQAGVHTLSARGMIPSNTEIEGEPGAVIKLANGANDFVLTIAPGATDIWLHGFAIDGNKANNPSGAAGIQCEDSNAARLLIENLYVHDCKASGMRLSGTQVKVTECNVTDCDNSGITGDLLTYFGFTNNYAARNLHHGIGCIGVCSYGVISDNTAEENGAPSVGADNFTGYGAALHHIVWDSNVSRKGKNNGVHVGGSQITFTNNIIEDADFYGLIARNQDLSPMPGFVAHGNTITNSGSNAGNCGVWLGNLVDFTWGPNNVHGSFAHGLFLQEGCTRGSITGGAYNNNGGGASSGSGIRLESCSDIRIVGATTAGNQYSTGLRIKDCTNITVSAHGGGGNASPITVDGTSANVRVTGCDWTLNSSDTPILTANCVSMWADSPNGGTNVVASAATIAIPAYTDLINITGAVNITTINGGWKDRVVRFYFAGALTMTTSGNKIMTGGTYTSAANSTLTMVYDGTTWREVGRA
jgi:hypothetical protein